MKYTVKQKKLWLIVLIIFLLGIVLFLPRFMVNQNCAQISDSQFKGYEMMTLTLDGKERCLLVADNTDKWTTGLMYVRKPVKFDGMIFMFPQKQAHTFWNMNTFEDLTLYWMDDEKVVGTSELPSIEKSREIVTVSSQKPVNIVVEVIK